MVLVSDPLDLLENVQKTVTQTLTKFSRYLKYLDAHSLASKPRLLKLYFLETISQVELNLLHPLGGVKADLAYRC